MITDKAYFHSLEGLTALGKIKVAAINWSESVLWNGTKCTWLEKLPTGRYQIIANNVFVKPKPGYQYLKITLCTILILPAVTALAIKTLNRKELLGKIQLNVVVEPPVVVEPSKDVHKASVYSKCQHPTDLLKIALQRARSELKKSGLVPSESEWRYAVFDLLKNANIEEGCTPSLVWGNVYAHDAKTCMVTIDGEEKTISTVDAFSSIDQPVYPLRIRQGLISVSDEQWRNGYRMNGKRQEEFGDLVLALQLRYPGFMAADEVNFNYHSSEICPLNKEFGVIPNAPHFIALFTTVLRNLIAEENINQDTIEEKMDELIERTLKQIFKEAFIDQNRGNVWLNAQICMHFEDAPNYEPPQGDQANFHHFALHATNELTSYSMDSDPMITIEPLELALRLQKEGDALSKETMFLLKKVSTHCQKYYSIVASEFVQAQGLLDIDASSIYDRIQNHKHADNKYTIDGYIEQLYKVILPNDHDGSCLLASVVEELFPGISIAEENKKIAGLRREIKTYLLLNKETLRSYVELNSREESWISCAEDTIAARDRAIELRAEKILNPKEDLRAPEMEALCSIIEKPIHVIARKPKSFNIENGKIAPSYKFGRKFERMKKPLIFLESFDYFKRLELKDSR